ncbi:hypothetical protein QFC20_000023 [Naganishia adeliensis]|uniref:Uncharacterized protein n=1 Tax=Naganishia adeliensis TaxID=92952 RepID=A0ACC2X112_9TREE|nr:hypothetical protein QFC20_000023 [Naganishia adeliensis]
MYRPIKLANGTTRIEEYLQALIHEESLTAIGWRQQWIYAIREFEDRLDEFSNLGPDFQNDKDYEPNENDVFDWGADTVYEWMMEHEIPKILGLFHLDQCGIEDMSKVMRVMVYYVKGYPERGDSRGSTKFVEDLFYFALNYKKLRLRPKSKKGKMIEWRKLKDDFIDYFVGEGSNFRIAPGDYLRGWVYDGPPSHFLSIFTPRQMFRYPRRTPCSACKRRPKPTSPIKAAAIQSPPTKFADLCSPAWETRHPLDEVGDSQGECCLEANATVENHGGHWK